MRFLDVWWKGPRAEPFFVRWRSLKDMLQQLPSFDEGAFAFVGYVWLNVQNNKCWIKNGATLVCFYIQKLCWYLQSTMPFDPSWMFALTFFPKGCWWPPTDQILFLAGYRLSFKQMCKDLPWCACICLANGQRISWNSHHRNFRRRLMMTPGSWAFCPSLL